MCLPGGLADTLGWMLHDRRRDGRPWRGGGAGRGRPCQRLREPAGDVGAGRRDHPQVIGALGSAGGQIPQHHVGMIGEIPVHRDLHAVDVHGDRLYPRGLIGRGLLVVLETPDQKYVGDDVGAGSAAMRRARKPDRGGQVAEAG